MPGKVILGAQWGDEGKGKFIDIFAGKADLVVRSQGGNNAGHTVVAGGEKYKLQLIPSGILYPECVNVIGPGVVVNPKAVLGEIDGLHEKGVSTDKLFIDARCHCIMPWHLELDALSEAEKAKEGTAIGTTKKGIGPTYMDKSERSGIRMHDFVDAERFEEVIRETCARKNRVITGVYGGEPIDADAVIAEYKVYADRLRPMVRDTTVMTYDAIKSGKEVLFEGAQGTLLDLDMGTYPYVTSSHPVAGGCCIGSGVGPTAINEIMGIFKSYTTRVGEGPFPTELFDETGEFLCKQGNEFGATTGRRRRTGWLDAVAVRRAVQINSLSGFCLTKLDVLDGLKEVKICVGYRMPDGREVTTTPLAADNWEGIEPIYETMPGWSETTFGVKERSGLPQAALNYIQRIEELTGVPVDIISTGPDRTETMILRDPFDA